MDMPSGEEVSHNAAKLPALIVCVTFASILARCCRSLTHTSTRRLLQAFRKQTQTLLMMMQVRLVSLQQDVLQRLQDRLAGQRQAMAMQAPKGNAVAAAVTAVLCTCWTLQMCQRQPYALHYHHVCLQKPPVLRCFLVHSATSQQIPSGLQITCC
jgi:hypothetical protein